MTTNDQPKRPTQIEAPRKDIAGVISPTRNSGTPLFSGWGPKLL